VTCTNLGVGQHTSLFRATDSVALQGPSISFKWRVTATPPPPDSVCGSSSSGGGRLITGTNGDDTLIGSSGTDLIKGNGGYDGINGCNREMSSKVQFFEINQLFHLLYVGSK
jgi:Ca2+-binding RTX toxin-like protein